MWWVERDAAAVAALRDDVVYWIVPALSKVRHGITDKPGRWPAGTPVPALCGNPVKIPFSTPFGSTPRSTSITDQCPECVAEYERLGFHSTVWDF